MQRALIIKKEHLDNIFDNGKTWEMRSGPINIKGRIGLIQSGSGLIVGEVTLVCCVKYGLPVLDAFRAQHQVEDIDLLKKWPYAWVLEGPLRYDKPIPYKHPQGAVIWVDLTKEGVIPLN